MFKENQYSLVIDSCKLSDSGEYKAVIENRYGQVQSKCRLNVLKNLNADNELSKNSPTFVELLKDITLTQGQDVCFKCKVTGVPAPEVIWYKDGAQIRDDSPRIKVT